MNDNNYTFTDAELKALAKMFSTLKTPKKLEQFYAFVKKYTYNTMSIDEAEKLFLE